MRCQSPIASFEVAHFLSTESAETNQPRATPWVGAVTQSVALKGQNKPPRRRLVSPVQGFCPSRRTNPGRCPGLICCGTFGANNWATSRSASEWKRQKTFAGAQAQKISSLRPSSHAVLPCCSPSPLTAARFHKRGPGRAGAFDPENGFLQRTTAHFQTERAPSISLAPGTSYLTSHSPGSTFKASREPSMRTVSLPSALEDGRLTPENLAAVHGETDAVEAPTFQTNVLGGDRQGMPAPGGRNVPLALQASRAVERLARGAPQNVEIERAPIGRRVDRLRQDFRQPSTPATGQGASGPAGKWRR